MAAFPFSMQGVILAKRTSFSWKGVYPWKHSARTRVSAETIVPLTSSTAAIGTKDTEASGEIR
jgi:hypothetical protein